MPAINKAIQDTGWVDQVFATGFALPSTMKTYLASGTCKQYALRSPYRYGYMATHCSILLKSGKAKNETGTKFSVPTVGERTIADGHVADLDPMLLFTEGHDDFDTAMAM